MFFSIPCKALPASMMVAMLTCLAACGGGSDHATPVVANPQLPDPPPQPAPAPPAELTLEAAYTAIAASTGFSQPNWPAWNHTGTAAVDGVGCARNENYHVHALLSVYRNGQRLAIPDSIGRGSGCSYEMHTHDGSGVIHIETDVPKTYTLGQFLALWGQSISAGSILGLAGPAQYYVIENEKITPLTTDPAAVVLAGRKEIVIITGTPPKTLPRYDWANSGL